MILAGFFKTSSKRINRIQQCDKKIIILSSKLVYNKFGQLDQLIITPNYNAVTK